MNKAWDAGEHEGCGKDSERAFLVERLQALNHQTAGDAIRYINDLHSLLAAAEARNEEAKAYVAKGIASFEGDPADSEFQKGYLAALEVVCDEAFPK